MLVDNIITESILINSKYIESLLEIVLVNLGASPSPLKGRVRWTDVGLGGARNGWPLDVVEVRGDTALRMMEERNVLYSDSGFCVHLTILLSRQSL